MFAVNSRASWGACLASKGEVSSIVKIFDSFEGQRKILRVASLTFESIEEIARARCTAAAVSGIAHGRRAVRTICTVWEGVHFVTTTIPSFFWTFKLLKNLSQGFFKQEPTSLNFSKEPADLAYNEIAQAPFERLLCMSVLIARSVRSTCAGIAFIGYYSLYSHGLQTVRVIRHASGFVGYAFEAGYQYLAFERALNAGEPPEKTYQVFFEKMVELALGLLEKGLQLLYDLAFLLKAALPPWFRLLCSFAIVAIGLIKVWAKPD